MLYTGLAMSTSKRRSGTPLADGTPDPIDGVVYDTRSGSDVDALQSNEFFPQSTSPGATKDFVEMKKYVDMFQNIVDRRRDSQVASTAQTRGASAPDVDLAHEANATSTDAVPAREDAHLANTHLTQFGFIALARRVSSWKARVLKFISSSRNV